MQIGFITIPTSSVDKSVRFYSDVLGFTLINRFSPQEGVTIAFMSDGHNGKLEFIEREGSVEHIDHSSCHISLGFEVENIMAVKKHLLLHNVDILSGPSRLPNGGMIMQAKDVNGMTLGFIQYRFRTIPV